MANRGYGYQYETSPRKLEPEYKKQKKTTPGKTNQKVKTQSKKSVQTKTKKKYKMSFEMKFFINSMLFFSMIFAIIACQALVEQRYKEKESLKQTYNEMLSNSNAVEDLSQNIRVVASEYGMQTKSATLIDLETSDYIEASTGVETESQGFFEKIANWFRENF